MYEVQVDKRGSGRSPNEVQGTERSWVRGDMPGELEECPHPVKEHLRSWQTPKIRVNTPEGLRNYPR